MAPSFFFDFKKKVLTYHKAGQGYAKTNTTRSNEGSIPHPPADSQPHPAECLSCGGVGNKGPLAGVHTMEPCRRAHRNGVIPIGTSIWEVTGTVPICDGDCPHLNSAWRAKYPRRPRRVALKRAPPCAVRQMRGRPAFPWASSRTRRGRERREGTRRQVQTKRIQILAALSLC